MYTNSKTPFAIKSISCIVVDDEPKARITFDEIVARYFSGRLKVVASVDSVKAAVAAIHELHPQIVFLDIEMPGETGFRLFDYFANCDFEVVFVTAYHQHAITAIKFAAIDYILKPINYIDLLAALARFEKKQDSHSTQVRVETLLSNLGQGQDFNLKLALPTSDGYQLIYLNDIVYLEADVNYTLLHAVSGKQLLVARTLKLVEEMLPAEGFFRIHKSYVVNMNYLKSYSKTEGFEITLETGEKLPVAQRKNEEFLRELTKKTERKHDTHDGRT